MEDRLLASNGLSASCRFPSLRSILHVKVLFCSRDRLAVAVLGQADNPTELDGRTYARQNGLA